MRRRVLWGGVLLVFVSGVLALASGYIASTSPASSQSAPNENTSTKSTNKISRFVVWQESSSAAKNGPVHARVEIIENASARLYTLADRGTITLVRPNGEVILTSQMHGADMVEECSPGEGFARTKYAFEMVPAPAAVELAQDELIGGTLSLWVGKESYVFELPEEPAAIRHKQSMRK